MCIVIRVCTGRRPFAGFYFIGRSVAQGRFLCYHRGGAPAAAAALHRRRGSEVVPFRSRVVPRRSSPAPVIVILSHVPPLFFNGESAKKEKQKENEEKEKKNEALRLRASCALGFASVTIDLPSHTIPDGWVVSSPPPLFCFFLVHFPTYNQPYFLPRRTAPLINDPSCDPPDHLASLLTSISAARTLRLSFVATHNRPPPLHSRHSNHWTRLACTSLCCFSYRVCSSVRVALWRVAARTPPRVPCSVTEFPHHTNHRRRVLVRTVRRSGSVSVDYNGETTAQLGLRVRCGGLLGGRSSGRRRSTAQLREVLVVDLLLLREVLLQLLQHVLR